MTQTDKIEKFILSQADILKANHIDIARSLTNNDWFVYRQSDEYKYYDYFAKFETVEELVNIIVQEMTYTLRCAIEAELLESEYDSQSIADMLDHPDNLEADPEELAYYLKFIIDNNLTQNTSFFEKLQELLES